MSAPPRRPFGRLWTAEEDALLGTRSELDLARELGRTIRDVRARRNLKGIRRVQPWRPEYDKLLGTRPDCEVARLAGRSLSNVAWRRNKLGIAPFHEHRPWTPEQLRLLGRRPDKEVALQTGHPLSMVELKRRQLGRPKARSDEHPAMVTDKSPDYISIPKHLRDQPVRDVGIIALEMLLGCAGIRVLGDLHGKRLSEFKKYSWFRRRTYWALRFMIFRALYPRAKPDPTWPIPVSWYEAEQSFEVPEPDRHLTLNQLPVSVRLEGVLRASGIERLGQLHGFRIRYLQWERNCGAKTLAELENLLKRSQAGEFIRSRYVHAPRAPGELLRLIDDLVSRLPERVRGLLTLHFGGTGEAPQTHRQIGQRYRITRSAVGLQIAGAIAWMSRQGRPRLGTLLDAVERNGTRRHLAFSPALVATWLDPNRPPRYSPAFYFHLISRFRPDTEMQA